MTFLLDVNILIALIDRSHVDSSRAHAWFAREGRHSFATCPLTENGVLRIVGGPRYPTPHGSASAVLPALEALCALPGHVFWPDAISLRDQQHLVRRRLLSSGDVTDIYLLALAVANVGRLATFDRKIPTEAVPDGAAALCLLT
ncbi:TA system VapC family ribonuclease toxin [Phenylobacterium sp.]|uniref:TA system VapC family ribonuclease toxin n=1 Tax=Phenylobacterium sp. TaxID=1871053 RepID=UPI0037C72C7E